MADPLPRRSALEAVYRPGWGGAAPERAAGLEIAERRGLSITQIAAFAGDETAVAAAIAAATGIAAPSDPLHAHEAGGRAVLWLGPARWWLVGHEADAVALDLGVPAALSAHGHGRVCLRLSGPALRDVLAKGCTLDWHPDVNGPGRCPQTVLFAIAALIHRRADDSADLYLPRSYAQDAWQALLQAAAEYGYRVLPPLN